MSKEYFDLPEGWSWQPLSALAEIVSGGTPSREVAEYWDPAEIAWVTPTDITGSDGRYLTSSKERISKAGLQKSSAAMLPVGTILMTSRATLGQAKISAVECCTNQGFKSLVPKTGVPPEYLYYLVQLFKNRYEQLGIGSTFLEVSKKDTEKFMLPVAPEEQRSSIAKIIDCVDNQIDATQALIDKYTAIKQGMMTDLFSRGIDPESKALRPTFEEAPELYHKTPLGMLPKGWDAYDIEDISDVIDPNPSHRNPIYRADGFAFISTVEFIEGDSVETNTSRRVAESVVLEQERRCAFNENSIVFSRKGTIGETRFVPTSCRFALLDSLCVLNPKNVDVTYFYHSLRSPSLKTQINQMVMGQALPQVSIGRVRELLIPMPNDAMEQRLIGQRIGGIAELLNSELLHLRKLQAQKSGLMQDLLTGKVPVPA
ncbi:MULTISPECIES: restriction endonuclease subunit S [Gammaproteobacteria]|uniref:restriction endonuclease subunit S n=1 Tax=Gammaproteobacteria TaxID=1236 RepID=UPI003A91CA67